MDYLLNCYLLKFKSLYRNREVLNLIINGLPSKPTKYLFVILALGVLNLIINGLPSKLDYPQVLPFPYLLF